MESKSKPIRFDYFRPCLTTHPEKIVNLEPYLNKLQQIENIEEEEINGPAATKVSINYIQCHSNYKIANGSPLPYPLWELVFPRTRIDVPGKKDKKTHLVRAVSLSAEEEIADETVFLYDKTTNIVIIQCNRSGASPSSIASFINNFVKKEENYIEFQPLLKLDQLERALSQETIYYVNLRLTNTNDPAFIKRIDESNDQSVKQLVAAANTIASPQEYAVGAEFTIAIGERSTKKSFLKDKITTLLRTLSPLIQEDKVDKLNIKGRKSIIDNVEPVDLIKDVIRDSYSFTITDQQRYISATEIFDKIVVRYVQRRQDFL